ncbi:VOC family protein [Deinococcus sedimenti]|uniref:VOC domain-containing protein n=1 Tax=Deinococcus sedimenti TaxID=1867090 RepID=A0ABQ2S4P2_9DEIO|nr:hypothetical protein [Deinococcus sedimenti]GGR88151.1 hypothetical protein GCM10008960_13960 [Deinococcus sedimenti]
MQLTHLTLNAPDLTAQRDFYALTLGLPTRQEHPDEFTVEVGRSRLTFRQGDTPAAHFALDIPRTQVDGAQAWLSARLSLLPDPSGQVRFGPDGAFHSSNLYFRDPAGHIVEFIARHDLPFDHAGPFGPAQVLHVSEFGLVVPDVRNATQWLTDHLDLRPWGDASPTFTPVGTPDGTLIVVPRGRGWFPIGQPAEPVPFTLTIRQGGARRTLTPATLPFLHAAVPA